MKLFKPSRRAAGLGARFLGRGSLPDTHDTSQGDDLPLQRYACFGSDDAFAEIVHRHAGWVYALCRRNLHDAHLAEDAAQAVFLLLARKAASIKPQTHLAGWLFQACRYVLADVRKHHLRYQRRQEMARDLALHRAADLEQSASDGEISAILDDAIASLRESDRQVILMRFYESMSVRQIAARLDIAPEAAKKRITRALSRLRKLLVGKPGVSFAVKRSALPLAGLSLLLEATATEAAPVGLALSIAKATTVPGLSSAIAEMIVAGVRQATLHATSKLLVAIAATAAPVAMIVTVAQPPSQPHPTNAPPVAAASSSAPLAPSPRPSSFAVTYNRPSAYISAPTPLLASPLRRLTAGGWPLAMAGPRNYQPPTVNRQLPLPPPTASAAPKRPFLAPPQPARLAIATVPPSAILLTKPFSTDSADHDPDPPPSRPRHRSQSPEESCQSPVVSRPQAPSGDWQLAGDWQPRPPDMPWPGHIGPPPIDLPPSRHDEMFADGHAHPGQFPHHFELMMLDALPPAAFLHEDRPAFVLHWRGPALGGPGLHDLLASREHDRRAAIWRDGPFEGSIPFTPDCRWTGPNVEFRVPDFEFRGALRDRESAPGTQHSAAPGVPEPSASACLLLVAGTLALRRRRRLSPSHG